MNPRRHFIRMFKPRFASLVEARKKRQTVRPWPKRMPRPGDLFTAKAWLGAPYRSKQRTLLERATMIGVHPCDITETGVALDGVALPADAVEAFARADGFDDFAEMRLWFLREHGALPFSGVLLCWQ